MIEDELKTKLVDEATKLATCAPRYDDQHIENIVKIAVELNEVRVSRAKYTPEKNRPPRPNWLREPVITPKGSA